MYVCRACARRLPSCVSGPRTSQAFSRTTTASIAATTAAPLQRPLSCRGLTTAGAATGRPRSDNGGLRNGSRDRSARGPLVAPTKMEEGPDEHRQAQLEATVRKRLRYLKNPYTIGKHVQELLAQDRFDEAVTTTRLASKNTSVHVSWNHLIQYLTRQGKLMAAISLYNEMKKRGQKPSPQTYTILFAGCTHSRHPQLAVREATRIYQGMLASTDANLRPSTVHMNAVLQVCARANDMVALFRIVETADPAAGRRPDALTYTTILNGLRFASGGPPLSSLRSFASASVDAAAATAADATGAKEQNQKQEKDQTELAAYQAELAANTERARSVWEEVISRWRQGQLDLDERLVSAMGSILVKGSYHDNNDVLSLLEQTVGIPRLDRPRQEWKKRGTEGGEEAADVKGVEGVEGGKAEETVEAAVAETGPNKGGEAALGESSSSSKASSADQTASAKTATQEVNVAAASSNPAAASSATTAASSHRRPFVPLPAGVVKPFPGGANGRDAHFSRKHKAAVYYVLPGDKILSLVLMSLAATRKTSVATQYWQTLCGPPYHVVPTEHSWYWLLMVLRRGHASTRVVEVLTGGSSSTKAVEEAEEAGLVSAAAGAAAPRPLPPIKMPSHLMDETTFRLAMGACAADNLNDQAFASAGKVLDLMNRTLAVPDVPTMKLYLKTAMTSHRHFVQQARGDGSMAGAAQERARFDFGRQVVRALTRLWDPVRIAGNAAGSALFVATAASAAPVASAVLAAADQEKLNRARRDYTELARQMMSAADMVAVEGMADEATIKDVRTTRNLLNRQITRFLDNWDMPDDRVARNRRHWMDPFRTRERLRPEDGEARPSRNADLSWDGDRNTASVWGEDGRERSRTERGNWGTRSRPDRGSWGNRSQTEQGNWGDRSQTGGVWGARSRADRGDHDNRGDQERPEFRARRPWNSDRTAEKWGPKGDRRDRREKAWP